MTSRCGLYRYGETFLEARRNHFVDICYYKRLRSICACTTKHGKLDVLQLARANICPWCAFVAKAGALDIQQCARANRCDWDRYTLVFAAEGGHRDVLMWVRENDFPKLY